MIQTSPNISEVSEALAKAQGKFTTARKNRLNKLHGNKYADLESLHDATRPALTSEGLAVVQSIETIGDRLRCVTRICHKSGQWIDVFKETIHSMKALTGGVTLHFYHPSGAYMSIYDLAGHRTLEVDKNCGAWMPTEASLIRSIRSW